MDKVQHCSYIRQSLICHFNVLIAVSSELHFLSVLDDIVELKTRMKIWQTICFFIFDWFFNLNSFASWTDINIFFSLFYSLGGS